MLIFDNQCDVSEAFGFEHFVVLQISSILLVFENFCVCLHVGCYLIVINCALNKLDESLTCN